ncbi:NmrA family NAD(P)-binding protein [Mycobacterium koreense]|uniref:NmrA-like domain-containing protein n=1 Tax=Mycolicibacillus koreensis TaxID=1069220 RepID=A0A7I7SG24_9MYCO|nr:NmrA family NAD(P)-binding protein [Mycolicibacillus koreensis]MCV7248531.1 NmrA family NAD(P)-binding protein [Mycolicibacillus koreensis]OSC32705.1 hypothetical protein B8W67_14485 [Mycolicibacillus koreensis]BBY55490.1 hypothetical protein MKOR_27410 [Mycolicibacillus koreensis]
MSDLTVLVAGANGNLGTRIARAMHARGRRVRCGMRNPGNDTGTLAALGDVVRADLDDPASLRAACDGVDVVVSAVQGGPDVIVDGQRRLLSAARDAGAARFVPSDYSLDLFALAPGENWNSDARRTFDDELISSGQGYTILLNGAFMEVIAAPFMRMVDPAAGTMTFWGDGTMPFDLTSMDDTAAYLAEIVGDPNTLNRVVQVVGQRLSVEQIARSYTEATGQPLRLQSRGGIEQGYAELERLKSQTDDPMVLLPLMYQLPMVSGKGRLTAVENDRYPQITPTTLTEVLRAQHNNSPREG